MIFLDNKRATVDLPVPVLPLKKITLFFFKCFSNKLTKDFLLEVSRVMLIPQEFSFRVITFPQVKAYRVITFPHFFHSG